MFEIIIIILLFLIFLSVTGLLFPIVLGVGIFFMSTHLGVHPESAIWIAILSSAFLFFGRIFAK